MNWYFVSAALIAFAVGLVHSVLGERMIFRRMRSSGFVPVDGGSALKEFHVRILWASWHLVTVLGWLVAAMLAWLSLPSTRSLTHSFLPLAIVSALCICAVVVLAATKGRHPGWVGLLAAAAFAAAGQM